MWALVVALALPLAGGCSDQEYVGEDGFYAFAITEDTPAFFETEDAALFLVEERIELPLRAPTDAQLAELSEGAEELPWARRPWVERHDYELELDWVLINLDDEGRTVTITVNGINEFHEYMPGFVVDDEEVIAEFAQWERTVRVGPQERLFGTIREEQLDEVAVDLATVVNGVSNANQVVHPDNHSSRDPRSMQFVPAIVPALTGVRVGLRSAGAGNLVMEVTARVRDTEGRVVSNVENAWELPEPEIFMPSSLMAEEEPAM
ncbi:MAG: hypothetical protein CMN31_04780 [Sandaracinus sp.]|nr:hypothetical protein [Sandaracinus sp.]